MRHELTLKEIRFYFSEHFFYPQANIYFCSSPKTGTTSIDTFLLGRFFGRKLNKPNGKEIYSQENRNHNLHRFNFTTFETTNQLKALKFLLAREPLQRLFSCWVNKFSGLPDPRTLKNVTDVQVNFNFFVGFLLFVSNFNFQKNKWGGKINKAVNFKSTITSQNGIGHKLGIPAYTRTDKVNRPTFEQFIRFIALGKLNEYQHFNSEELRTFNHWTPISTQCYPCDIK